MPNSEYCGLVNENPAEGCFLCDPEAWRIIFETQNFQVVAGLGPLCAGYILVATTDHVETLAQIPANHMAEFLLLDRLVREALAAFYGNGLSSYEHGKVGSCMSATAGQRSGTYCFHAHRVYIPHEIDIHAAIRPYFDRTETLADGFDIGIAGQEE